MPNVIKYCTSTLRNTIRKNNICLGINTIEYGPTDNGVVIPVVDVTSTRTFFWNGITPPSGGFTIYTVPSNTTSPSIVCPTDSGSLIYWARVLGGTNISTSGDAIGYITTGLTNSAVVNIDFPDIVTSGLVMTLDAGFTSSYPTIGSTWVDVSGSGNTGTLNNFSTSAFNSTSGGTGALVFDGTNDYVSTTDLDLDYITIGAWVNANSGTQGFIVNKNFSLNVVPYSLNVGGNNAPTSIDGMAFYPGFWVHSGINTDIRGQGWKYVVGTFDGTTLAYYINGSLDSSSLEGSGRVLPKNNVVADIGRYSNDSAYFGGAISMVHIYNRALSSTEILSNFNNTKSRFGL